MNWIQQHVLIELTRHATCRYTDLRPDGIEGNLFAYHLKGLSRDGLVEKAADSYRLTSQGLRTAGLLSLQTGKIRMQPKILNAIICTDANGRYLMSRWHRQPNTGGVSFPHGMMHYGASHLDMARQELAEKAGLTATLAYRGEVYLRGLMANETDRHMLVHLFQATDPQPLANPPWRPDVSEPFWSHLKDIAPNDFVAGFHELAQVVIAADPSRPIYQDITFEVKPRNS